MIVLKATQEQKEALEGVYEHNEELRFVEDANGNWVVNITVLSNGDFLSIRPQLEALPQIEFNPKQVNI